MNTPDFDQDGLPNPQRAWAILAISLNTLMVVIEASIIIIALPNAARSLAITKSQAISLVSVTQFVTLIAMLPLAALGDRVGHTRLYRVGQALAVMGALLCFVAPTLPMLLAARALQAIGSAAVLSVGIALLRAVYPSASLGKGLGINGVLISIGAAIAPSLGGIVVATLGWRWVFLCPLPLAIGSLFFGRSLPRSIVVHPSFDWRGALYYALSVALIAGASSSLSYGRSLLVAALFLAVAIVVVTLFVRREAARARPILPVDLLVVPGFALSVAAAFAAFTGAMTMTLSMPFRLEAILGEHPAEIGAIMMAWPLAMMISAPLAGALADRLPGGSLSALGMALACAGYVAIAALPEHVGHVGLVLRIALCGLGMGFFISPNSRLLIGATPRARTASAGGLMSTTRILGQSSGAALVALLVQPGFGRGISAAVVASVFALLAGLLSLANLVSSTRRVTRSLLKPTLFFPRMIWTVRHKHIRTEQGGGDGRI